MSEESQKKSGCSLACGKAGLVASLAVNIFLVGMLSASFLRGPRGPFHEPPFPPPFPPMMEAFASSLGPEDAAKLREITENTDASIRAHHEDIREATLKIATLLRQDKPDLQALQAATDQLEAVGKGFHQSMAQSLLQIASTLSLDARKKIADRLEHGHFAFPLHGPDDPHQPQDRFLDLQRGPDQVSPPLSGENETLPVDVSSQPPTGPHPDGGSALPAPGPQGLDSKSLDKSSDAVAPAAAPSLPPSTSPQETPAPQP